EVRARVCNAGSRGRRAQLRREAADADDMDVDDGSAWRYLRTFEQLVGLVRHPALEAKVAAHMKARRRRARRVDERLVSAVGPWEPTGDDEGPPARVEAAVDNGLRAEVASADGPAGGVDRSHEHVGADDVVGDLRQVEDLFEDLG